MPRYPKNEDPAKDFVFEGACQHRSLWNLYARVKYRAAAKAPREPGKRPADLEKAAGILSEALETCWRAGYRSEDLAEELLRTMRPTPKGSPP